VEVLLDTYVVWLEGERVCSVDLMYPKCNIIAVETLCVVFVHLMTIAVFPVLEFDFTSLLEYE